MKNFLNEIYTHAVKSNHHNIFGLLEENKLAVMLDLGCDNGSLTKEFANHIKTNSINGVEIVRERIDKAIEKGINVKNFDLNGKFDYINDQFDVIIANQVIEHLYNSDNFLSEIYRILKPGGYAVISTENASSWCNIFASIMGWQIFSLTNISNKKQGIGNPLALHKNDPANIDSWNHVRIYNILGLKNLLEVFNFKIEEIKGAGYFPLPSSLGNIDKIHSHFITYKIRKLQENEV